MTREQLEKIYPPSDLEIKGRSQSQIESRKVTESPCAHIFPTLKFGAPPRTCLLCDTTVQSQAEVDMYATFDSESDARGDKVTESPSDEEVRRNRQVTESLSDEEEMRVAAAIELSKFFRDPKQENEMTEPDLTFSAYAQEEEEDVVQIDIANLAPEEAVQKLRQIADELEQEFTGFLFTPEEKAEMWAEELLKKSDKVPTSPVFECRSLRSELIREWAEELLEKDTSAAPIFECRSLRGELVREYAFDGDVIRIEEPKEVHISESGSHRVVSEDGWVTHIPAGWRILRWLPRDLRAPVAF